MSVLGIRKNMSFNVGKISRDLYVQSSIKPFISAVCLSDSNLVTFSQLRV